MSLGGEVAKFLAAMMDQFVATKLWSMFTPSERMRSTLLRLTMRPSAVCFQLVLVRSQENPFALFKLLDPASDKDTLANQLLQTPPCTLDAFTKAFTHIFDTVDKVKGDDALEVLRLIAVQSRCSTYSTERLHSRNLRRAKSRAVTHHISVADLALPHLAYSGPTFLHDIVNEPVQDRHSRKRTHPPGEDKPSNKKLRTGGGGAWRAFIHHRLGGRKLTGPLVQALRDDYHTLTINEKRYYNELGMAGHS